MRRGLTLDQIAAARRTRGRAALLYVTDRCPVGCAHCSVDALPRGPRITDWPRFLQVLRLLCEEPALSVVGISGGEPFTEPRALLTAARRLTAAGRHVVPYTSGNWAAPGPTPPWIREVLRLSSCVILSTDAYHAARLPPTAFVTAARATAAENTWLACQTLTPDESPAKALLRRAFGPDWPSYAELTTVPLLPYGRAKSPDPHTEPHATRPPNAHRPPEGAGSAHPAPGYGARPEPPPAEGPGSAPPGPATEASAPQPPTPAPSTRRPRGDAGSAHSALGSGARPEPPLPGPVGPCVVAGTPVVRYDGRVAVCCNERVAAGGGPAGLHRSVDEPDVLGRLAGDAYLTVLGALGAGPLLALPGYRDLAAEGGDLCGVCWRMVARGTGGAAVRALAALAGGAS